MNKISIHVGVIGGGGGCGIVRKGHHRVGIARAQVGYRDTGEHTGVGIQVGHRGGAPADQWQRGGGLYQRAEIQLQVVVVVLAMSRFSRVVRQLREVPQ